MLLLAYGKWRDRARFDFLSELEARTLAHVEWGWQQSKPSPIFNILTPRRGIATLLVLKKITFRADDPPQLVQQARSLFPYIEIVQETTPHAASTTTTPND
jgi:hypothetical protein